MRRMLALAAGLPGLAALFMATAADPPPPRIELNPGASVPLPEGEKRWVPVIAFEPSPAPDEMPSRFLAGYTTGDWTGHLVKTRPDPQEEPLWDAGALLDARPPRERSLWTVNAGTSVPVPFASASFAQFDTALQAAFEASPRTGAADGGGTVRVEYLRGDRTLEPAGILRARKGILGDIVHSGPVYKAGASSKTGGSGHAAFAAAVAGRAAVVYAGANDGFLHAFRASDGHELWAYMPRAVAHHAPQLADPRYLHRPYVDGLPSVSEAQPGGEWRTVLASGMGGGAPGLFALDVTWPEVFGAGEGRREATALFEFTAADDPDIGEILAPPLIARVRVSPPHGKAAWRWFAITGSGYNAGGTTASHSRQAVFFLALDKPRGTPWREGENYHKIVLPSHGARDASGLGPVAMVPGAAGEASLLYAGDLQGRLWRLDLSHGLTAAAIAGESITGRDPRGEPLPFFVASGPDGLQPITSAAAIAAGPEKGHMVVFGTGRFLARGDERDARQQRIYAVWDRMAAPSAAPIGPDRLARRSGSDSGEPFILGEGKGEYLGCYVDLAGRGERVVRDAVAGLASVAIASFTPEDTSARLYLMDAANCAALRPPARPSPGGPPAPVLPQAPPAGQAIYSQRDPTGRRRLSIVETAHLPVAGAADSAPAQASPRSFEAGRVSWRELRG